MLAGTHMYTFRGKIKWPEIVSHMKIIAMLLIRIMDVPSSSLRLSETKYRYIFPFQQKNDLVFQKHSLLTSDNYKPPSTDQESKVNLSVHEDVSSILKIPFSTTENLQSIRSSNFVRKTISCSGSWLCKENSMESLLSKRNLFSFCRLKHSQ